MLAATSLSSSSSAKIKSRRYHCTVPFFRSLLFPVMDPKHSGTVLKHLEKQHELLMDAYRSMSHELHRLQVEEELLMRKYYQFMAAQGLIEKKTNSNTNVNEDKETSND